MPAGILQAKSGDDLLDSLDSFLFASPFTYLTTASSPSNKNKLNIFFSKTHFLLWEHLKAHSRLRQFLATERPLKIMKNAFYFTLKALLVLKIFKILS